MTIAFSVALSAFNALTLTPALSALLLDREPPRQGRVLHQRRARHHRRHQRVRRRAVAADAAPLGDGARVRGCARADVLGLSHRCRSRSCPPRTRDISSRIVQAPAGASLQYTGRHRAPGGADPPQGSRGRGRVLGHGLQLQRRGAEPGADLREPEAVRRSAKAPSIRCRPCWGGCRASSPAISGANIFAVAAAVDSRAWCRSAGSSSRCSIRRARTSTRWRTPPMRWPAPGNQSPKLQRSVHLVHCQRPAAQRPDRSRSGAGARTAGRRSHERAADLPRIAVCQRLRLQQPCVPRLRAGRPGVPFRPGGAEAVLRP